MTGYLSFRAEESDNTIRGLGRVEDSELRTPTREPELQLPKTCNCCLIDQKLIAVCEQQVMTSGDIVVAI